MIVAQVQVEGCCGPCVHKDTTSAIGELTELIKASLSGDGKDPIRITFAEMTEAEFDALGEFMGY